jgi:hypothetical protein
VSLFDDLVARGPVKNPFGIAPAATPRPPADDPVASFETMEAAIDEELPAGRVDDPVTPCQKPWLELTLTDEAGDPYADLPYTLELPTGETREGTLDAHGHLHLDGVDLEPKEWLVEGELTLGDDGATIACTLKIVETATAAEEAEPEDEELTEESSVEFAITELRM